MSQQNISLKRFTEILPSLCAADTAAGGGKGWTPENPTWGHCAVASLLAQNLFGGELLRISLKDTEFAAGGSHYYNRFPDGATTDTTVAQFSGRLPVHTIPAETRTREYVIGGADTRQRYANLACRLACALNGDAGLFGDSFYRACLTAAYASPCKKMGFGAAIVHSVHTKEARIVAVKNNQPIDCLRDMCEPECIRLRITSRTESMLGACGHAEEWALQYIHQNGLLMAECGLCVAGVDASGTPLLKDKAEFTCLRCAVAMHLAGLGGVYVPVRSPDDPTHHSWYSLSTAECIATAKEYALRHKTV